MFFGTTPQIISQFLVGEMKDVKPARVIVPFAGNFVVEQLAAIVDPNTEILSTDISLYSRLIGYGIMGKECGLHLKEEIFDDFPILRSRQSPRDKAIEVIFMAEMMSVRKKQHHAYYKNIYHDAQANAERYLDKIAEKFDRFKAPLANLTFYGTDGVLLCDQAKKGDLLFYDPPVDVGNYEKEFAALNSAYEDPEDPAYTVMTDEVKTQNLVDLHERGVIVYYRNNNPTAIAPPTYQEVFRYVYKYGAAYCVYTNKPNKTFVGSFSQMKETVKNYHIIGPEDTITETSEIQIVRVKSSVSNHYRMMWVKKAEMLDSGIAFLVFCDGKLIGVMQLLSALKFGTDLCVINSDPAAPTSKYVRLSKLMLHIICTQEVLDMFNEMTMWDHKGFTTRVFSNAPVSMKYRYLFELTERKDDDGFYKFCLIYQNRKKIFPTIKDGLKAWLSKEAHLTKLTH